jgi:hypothetical protein
MKIKKLFQNITWPEGCVYNLTGKAGSKAAGGADVEHHSVEEHMNVDGSKEESTTGVKLGDSNTSN